jgi:hypothetical protein
MALQRTIAIDDPRGECKMEMRRMRSRPPWEMLVLKLSGICALPHRHRVNSRRHGRNRS